MKAFTLDGNDCLCNLNIAPVGFSHCDSCSWVLAERTPAIAATLITPDIIKIRKDLFMMLNNDSLCKIKH